MLLLISKYKILKYEYIMLIEVNMIVEKQKLFCVKFKNRNVKMSLTI